MRRPTRNRAAAFSCARRSKTCGRPRRACKPATRYPWPVDTRRPYPVFANAKTVAAFRATGKGWQRRMSDALRTYLREHPLAV
ncbi:BrnA antitoxin family protein [Burkholderia ubonensis]|uniref:BrnA antitoxin family protein n=1 Tax=Burkholderia ubonensis TaxID=101571 RepID=UPI0009B301DB|nr:BrnA antitoxin family protein [Burkholderia ubonensis]